ncbi:MAG: acyl-protein synthetase [Clostridia bacterium]|nr:acyl-protein synthetase [Clostridia bacterium]MBQ3869201.1 acyl-protein synthetase [Clostridia bacterium]
MRYVGRLFNKKPYGKDGGDFVKAAAELTAYHIKKNKKYKITADQSGFTPDMLKSEEDLCKLPFIPTAVFKRNRLFTQKRFTVKVTTSGTSGGAGEIAFDIPGLFRALKMSLHTFAYKRLFSPRLTNYIVFGYKPDRKNRTGVSKTAFGATLFAPALHRTYALTRVDGKYTADLQKICDKIVEYSKKKHPVRFMGFPSYTYFAIKLLEDRKISVKLPEGSKIMLAGGWKQYYKEQVDKEEFYSAARRVLGVDDKDIIEFFGAVEHPVIYCDCENHHFHVPSYSRVIIRDVNTLEPLPYGRVGLVELITPMIKATPITAVMTDDLGILHPGGECGCGLDQPYLEIVGRVGLKDVKTCAAGAAELLKEVKL